MSSRPKLKLLPRTPRALVKDYGLEEIVDSKKVFIIQNIKDGKTLNVPMTKIFV